MSDKPLIGITSGRSPSAEVGMRLVALPSYTHAVEVIGGLPVIIPLDLTLDALQGIYRRLDGVLLPGGGDVAASAYGAPATPAIERQDEARDAAEFALCHWAVRDDKPLLAICRGIQVLNVALGGTLYSHIPDEFPTNLEHDRAFLAGRAYLAHTVSVSPDSLLSKALGVAETRVNSMHHQAVRQAADDLRVVARAADGLIEGVEHPRRRFVVGVQWHPEELVDTDPAMRRLFWAFVQAAAGHDDWKAGA
jgi:putative glutamine amidotransferase